MSHRANKRICVTLDAERIRKIFLKKGYVIFPDVMDDALRRKLVKEIWDKIENLPFKPGKGIKRPADPMGPLTKHQAAALKKNWFPGAFGGPTFPPFFHLDTVWELRQSDSVHGAFQMLWGDETELRVSIDRVGVRLPREGIQEQNHWDSDPFHPVDLVQGMIALNDTQFWIVRNSHTEEFFERYRKLFPERKTEKARDVTFLSEEDVKKMGPDAELQPIDVPAGALVIWSDKLMHGTKKNMSDFIRYTVYISMNPAKEVEKLQPREKRIQSYLTGKSPGVYPSGYPIRVFPKMWIVNHRKLLQEYVARLDPRIVPLIKHTVQSGKNEGEVYYTFDEWIDPNYRPPPLSPLGYSLLGYKPSK